MKPEIPCTDRRFKYVVAAESDIRRTFRRVVREQAKADKAKRQAEIEALHEEALLENAAFDAAREAEFKVRPIIRRRL